MRTKLDIYIFSTSPHHYGVNISWYLDY